MTMSWIRTNQTRGGKRRRFAAGIVLLLFANLVACTEYVPVRGSIDASAAHEVRVTLSDQGTIDVAPRLGQRVEQLEGVLQGMTDSTLSLTVRKVSRQGGIEDTYQGELVTLAARDFESVGKARTSVGRSLLLAAGITAAAFLVAKGAGDLSGGKTPGPPPPTR
jgi:hypothetical protein